MKHLKLFEGFSKVKKRKVHSLSGIALIVEGKMLLVLATKHVGQVTKWSIPKGHIEGKSLESALKELKEETGIILDDNFDELIELSYNKADAEKIMDVYIYKRDRSEFEKYLNRWEIKPKFLDPAEISSAKFYGLNGIRKRLDIGMIEILDSVGLV